jgi:hypothetical protein
MWYLVVMQSCKNISGKEKKVRACELLEQGVEERHCGAKTAFDMVLRLTAQLQSSTSLCFKIT